MSENLLLKYSEQLASEIEMLCKNIKGNSNTIFQIRKSSSSVYANIMEAQYPQSLPDMLSKFKIARKECSEREYWLELLIESGYYDNNDILDKCIEVKKLLITSINTSKSKLNK